jgi:3-oxoacyl-[acyl-carrier protein] reductase
MFVNFDDISIGDFRKITRVISLEDINKFVEITGDTNPLHLDSDFAKNTPFKKIVAHGMLGASFLSTVIGTKLPGPGALWISQNLNFLLPVRLGDELVIACKVKNKYPRDRLLDLDTTIHNQNGDLVLSGSGRVKMLMNRENKNRLEQKNIRSKVVIITGGSGGIGSAVCQELVRKGYKVVFNYFSNRDRAETLIKNLQNDGVFIEGIQVDSSTQEGAKKLYDLASRYGNVEILINNMSSKILPKPFLDTEWVDVDKHINLQLKSSFLLSKLCLPDMIEAKYGRIINITSQATDGVPTINWCGYTLAKSSLAMLTKILAAEFGMHSITVNSISPGMTETEFIDHISEKSQLMAARANPMRRLAEPFDVASTLMFLISDEASYITGQSFRVNGGSEM